MANRRDKFRAYMSKLEGAAPPQLALDEGLCVDLPGRSVAGQIVTRLDLKPTSSHLLVGGIGSGKSTQLLLATRRLNEITDTHAFYVDVALKHDLEQFQSGVLLALAGVTLSKHAESLKLKEGKEAREVLIRWARGWKEWIPDDPDDEGPPDDWEGWDSHQVEHRGVLSPARQPLDGNMREAMRALNEVRASLEATTPHLVVLFDSLDRLVSPPQTFVQQVEQDIRAIKEAGVGVALVGPLSSLFGHERAVAQYFDHIYLQAAVDTTPGNDGRAFLATILRMRDAAGMLPDDALSLVIDLSGGVLRDAINIAQRAGEEAYVAGAERVSPDHVRAAGDTLGRELMMGLGTRELDVLRGVSEKAEFVPSSDSDLALLVTRRVLDYGNPPLRYRLHPTLRPFLEIQAHK